MVIDPESRFATLWSPVMAVVLVVHLLAASLLLAFPYTPDDPTQLPVPSALFALFAVAEVGFLVDPLVGLHLGFFADGRKVVDLTTVRARYVCSYRLWLALAGCIPVVLGARLFYAASPNSSHPSVSGFKTMFVACAVPKVLRIVTLPSMLNEWELGLAVARRGMVRAAITVLYGFLLAHLLGVTWLAGTTHSTSAFAPSAELRDFPAWKQYVFALRFGKFHSQEGRAAVAAAPMLMHAPHCACLLARHKQPLASQVATPPMCCPQAAWRPSWPSS